MKRVQLIGCAGAGKTTLAAALSRQLDIPWQSLDQLFFNPGWELADPEERDRRLAPILKQDCWVIEGNYTGSMPQRLALADTLIFLDLPPRIYVPRVIWRSLKYRGKVRSHMADGCPERFDWEFLHYVLTFRSRNRKELVQIYESFQKNRIHLTSKRQVADFLKAAV